MRTTEGEPRRRLVGLRRVGVEDGARARLGEGQLAEWGRRIGERVGGEGDGAAVVVGGGAAVAWGDGAAVFIGLRGPLGAGKSVLARAVARGAGVEGAMPSPTFNLVFRYALPGGGTLVHADLYRIASVEELAGLGWDSMLGDGVVALVEWPERAGRELPEDRWEIELEIADEPGVRVASARRFGEPAPAELPCFPTGQGRTAE